MRIPTLTERRWRHGKLAVFDISESGDRIAEKLLVLLNTRQRQDAGVLHESFPHVAGVEEYIFLVQGRLKMTIGEKEVLLQEKQSLRFGADIFHVYHNDSDRDCAAYNVIFYPNS